MRAGVRASLCTGAVALTTSSGCSSDSAPQVELGNPYANVDWQTFSHHKADLHLHTLQSDGCHLPNEVVRVFHEAGFSVLSLTDHDAMAPNQCPGREAAGPGGVEVGFFADEPSPYPDPRPANFPLETTWPWSAFGAPSPGELGIVGIEGAELTCTYHINSFFNDYGAGPCGDDHRLTPSDWLVEVARRGGLAVLNHPGGSGKADGLGWAIELYGNPANDHLVGMELSGGRGSDLHVAMWDQLLDEFMPARPIWGFGTSDMHFLVGTNFGFTVFLLDELTEENVKEAMRTGQFYAVTGPGTVNLSRDRRQDAFAPRAAYDGTYPELRSIVVNEEAAEISIDASGYDEIVWLSNPSPSEPSTDGEAATPWRAGQIVARGPVFNYSDSVVTSPYVRAELIRHTDAGPLRVFINPFALTRR
jgi:hypothetical protein